MAEQEILGTEITAAEPMLADEQTLHAEEQGSHNLYRKLLAGGTAVALAAAGAAEAKLMDPVAGKASIRHCSSHLIAGFVNDGKAKNHWGQSTAQYNVNDGGHITSIKYSWHSRNHARFCGLRAFTESGDTVYPASDSRTKVSGVFTDKKPLTPNGISELFIYFRPPSK